jgi:hypothetical protein
MERLWYYTRRKLHIFSMERKANHQLKMVTPMHTCSNICTCTHKGITSTDKKAEFVSDGMTKMLL